MNTCKLHKNHSKWKQARHFSPRPPQYMLLPPGELKGKLKRPQSLRQLKAEVSQIYNRTTQLAYRRDN